MARFCPAAQSHRSGPIVYNGDATLTSGSDRARPPPMSTPEGGSVSKLIKDFRGGDPEAFDALWKLYFDRLVAMATKLAASVGEDAALSAFHSFHRRARRGDFPEPRRSRRPLGPVDDPHPPEDHRHATTRGGLEARGRRHDRPRVGPARLRRRRRARVRRDRGPRARPAVRRHDDRGVPPADGRCWATTPCGRSPC